MDSRPRFIPPKGLFLLALIILGMAAPALQADEAIDAAVREFNQVPRQVRAGQKPMAVNYVELEGVAYGYAVPRRMARLAEGKGSFRITNVKVRRDHLLLKLATPDNAVLEMRIFGRTRLPEDKRGVILSFVLKDLFDFGAALQHGSLVGNSESKLVHIGSCNHLPEAAQRTEFASLESAVMAGYRACPACFALTSFVLMEDYGQARIGAVEDSRVFEIIYPPVDDPAIQARLDGAATRVLDNFPIDLLGLEYAFKVVDSSLLQAYALATGFIYVTDQLMSAIESEVELEFLLAHEVAHCELHLKPNKPAYRDPVGMHISPPEMVERSADILALECLSRMGRDSQAQQAGRLILAKLQFANEMVPITENNRWGAEADLAQRLALFDDQMYAPMHGSKPVTVVAGTEGAPFEAVALGCSRGDKKASVFLLVSGTDLLNKPKTIARIYSYLLTSAGGLEYAVKPTWSSEIGAETNVVLEFEGPRPMYDDLRQAGIASIDIARSRETRTIR